MFIFISILLVLFGEITAGALGSEWTGPVFPGSNPVQGSKDDDEKFIKLDQHGRIPMGIKNEECDLGKDVNKLDGDLGETSYTCYEDRSKYKANPNVEPISFVEHIPKELVPMHFCMNETITYRRIVPTYGDHRPLWPRYGEYTFLPKQRWLHSLEHGSIVMLYHPCADKNEVKLLKSILQNCLYQYVITSLNELGEDRPIVLVAWGKTLEMSKVDPDIVVQFIRRNAFKAPEKINRDGQYDLNLIEPSPDTLKGKEDTLCPKI